VSAAQSVTSVRQLGSGGIYTTAVTIEAPAPGFLVVRLVTDHMQVPLKDLVVKFYPSDSSGAIKGAQLGADATTDRNGVAGLDQHLDPGYFALLVEGMTIKARPIDTDTYFKASLKPTRIGLPRGFLAVRLLFRNLPLKGFKVKFFEIGKDGAKTGSALGTQEAADKSATTGEDGVASLGTDEFRVGNYVCEVAGKELAVVSTVEDAKRPYTLALPIVRPLLMLQEPGRVLDVPEVPEQPDPSSGYLSVRVIFRGLPAPGLRVTFFAASPDGRAAVDQPRGESLTDENGVAILLSRAKLGNYFCQVEGQSGFASLSTVEDPAAPYTLILPIGRPLVDVTVPGRIESKAEVEERPPATTAYLSVMVLFRDNPAVGLRVAFFASTPGGTADTAQPKGEAITDGLGIASLEAKAKLGNYFCRVEGQDGFNSVGTVTDRDLPYVVNLPAGRPYLEKIKPGDIPDFVAVEEKEPPPKDA